MEPVEQEKPRTNGARRMVKAWACALAIGLAVSPLRGAQSVSTFLERLVAVRTEVRRARRDTPTSARARLRSALQSIRTLDSVQVEQGTVKPDLREVTADLTFAASDPERSAQSLRQLEARLDYLIASARSMSSAERPSFDAGQARTTLRRVLSRREFQARRTEPTLWERIVEWIMDMLARLFGGMSRAQMRSIASLILWTGAGLALCLTAWLIYCLVPGLFSRKRKPEELSDSDISKVSLQSLGVPELVEEARRAVQRGEMREALRLVFRALLLTLDRHRLIKFDESVTNGEYLRDLTQTPAVRAAVEPVALRFEERWYGGLAASEVDVQEAFSALEGVSALADATAVPTQADDQGLRASTSGGDSP